MSRTPIKAQFTAKYPAVDVLEFIEDKNLDVLAVVRTRHGIRKAQVRHDEYGMRYFCAEKCRVYLEDLQKVCS